MKRIIQKDTEDYEGKKEEKNQYLVFRQIFVYILFRTYTTKCED